jgi:hypothetical protein
MDYFFNSGGQAPYVNYISNAMERTQKFAIGKTYATFATSHNEFINPGNGNSTENGTHTGDVPGFTGDDVQYKPSANGQNVVITFGTEVQNVSFTLYDIDGSARIDVDAFNAANVAQNVSVTTYGSTILSVTNDNSIDTYVSATSGSNLDNNSNDGTATFSIAGPVNRIVITVTTIGSDPVFWLSDINACVPGSFPTNYHQSAPNLQPFHGPVANQPQYFLVTPDNDGVYMVDPATGNAKFLFRDNERHYVNSFAYDPYHRILYYISENNTIDANNKNLRNTILIRVQAQPL